MTPNIAISTNVDRQWSINLSPLPFYVIGNKNNITVGKCAKRTAWGHIHHHPLSLPSHSDAYVFQGIGAGDSHFCGINSNLDAICWGEMEIWSPGKDAISMLPKGYKWKVSYLL